MRERELKRGLAAGITIPGGSLPMRERELKLLMPKTLQTNQTSLPMRERELKRDHHHPRRRGPSRSPCGSVN